jgi:hypothetical protein
VDVKPDAIRKRLHELNQSLEGLPEPVEKEQDDHTDLDIPSRKHEDVELEPDEIRDSLNRMRQTFNALPEADEPPSTTLQLLGRSRTEKFWQRFLVYFLDPQKSHGLGEELLESFLTSLSNRHDPNFSFSRLHLQDVQIEEEVTTGQGRPDAVIWSPEEWFVCIEIKVDSAEGKDQTKRYVDADAFKKIDLRKSAIPEDRHHYLYIAPENAPLPEATEFEKVSWESVASELRSFLADSYGEHPSRTVAQLNDFIDTIRSELIMTEYQENRREKVELAIEHYEPMQDVLNELGKYVEDLQQEWPDWFLNQDPEYWDDEWRTRGGGNSYAQLTRDDWIIDHSGWEDDKKEAGLFAYWEIRIADRFVGGKEFDHTLAVTGVDDKLLSSFRDSFYDEEVQEEVRGVLAELNTNSRKQSQVGDWADGHTYKTLVESAWEFEETDVDSFEETTVEAFEDMQPIFDLVTESIPER